MVIRGGGEPVYHRKLSPGGPEVSESNTEVTIAAIHQPVVS